MPAELRMNEPAWYSRAPSPNTPETTKISSALACTSRRGKVAPASISTICAFAPSAPRQRSRFRQYVDRSRTSRAAKRACVDAPSERLPPEYVCRCYRRFKGSVDTLLRQHLGRRIRDGHYTEPLSRDEALKRARRLSAEGGCAEIHVFDDHGALVERLPS